MKLGLIEVFRIEVNGNSKNRNWSIYRKNWIKIREWKDREFSSRFLFFVYAMITNWLCKSLRFVFESHFFFFAIQALLSFICSRNIPDITRIAFSCWKKARSKNLESFYSDIDTRNNVASNKVLRTLDNTCKIAFWMEKQESSDQSFEPLRFSRGGYRSCLKVDLVEQFNASPWLTSER